ncbi:MAG: SpoIID/LytB domain-containing protein, partial [Candidatus Methylomirabilales bacterium]
MGTWLIISFLLLFVPRLAWAEEWPVRVLLSEGVSTIHLKAAGPSRLEELGGGLVEVLPPGKEVRVAWEGRAGASFRLRPDRSLFWMNRRLYRGNVEIWNTSGGLQVINQVNLEDYVRGVMKVEADPEWPVEALKTQAVVARTYALYERLASPAALFHLHATTASQVYRGVNGEDPRTDRAVRATRGIVLAYRGRIIPAFYHAASGGRTEDAVEVWEKKYPFIVGVEDPYSTIAPHQQWEASIPRSEIHEALERVGGRLGAILKIDVVRRTRSGRVSRMRIWDGAGFLEMDGKRFRQLLGPDRIRSTRFTVYADGPTILFVGHGWGHGVGLSQWGAKGMADLAYDYAAILKHYFPLAELVRLPSPRSELTVHGLPQTPEERARETGSTSQEPSTRS